MESNSTDIEGRHQPLVLRLQSAVAHMAPHQRDRQNGRLLIECLEAITDMEIRHAVTMMHTQTIVEDANAMREWIMQAAPMLSVASCIVIDDAVDRLGEIAGCRAVLELCPVDFISPENSICS
jgi:hypothetical protein